MERIFYNKFCHVRIANEKNKLLRYIFLDIIQLFYSIFGIGKYNDITVKK